MSFNTEYKLGSDRPGRLPELKQQFKFAAIDCETLSLRDNAAIIQIGLVFFNATGERLTFGWDVDFKYYDNCGHPFHISAETFAWWLGQSADAVGSILNRPNPIGLPGALLELTKFISAGLSHDGGRIVTNGPNEDERWLMQAYRLTLGQGLPWEHWRGSNLRDLRAAVPESIMHLIAAQPGMVKHNAISDANWAAMVAQAYHQLYEQVFKAAEIHYNMDPEIIATLAEAHDES